MNLQTSGLVVGMDWWGVGPSDMANQVRAAGYRCSALPVWDLQRRADRKLINTRVAPWLARRRVRTSLRAAQPDWAVVTSPHRLVGPPLLELRAASRVLVALLGDDPTYQRSVPVDAWDQFDLVAAADPAWLSRVPEKKRRTEPWGSTVTDGELLAARPYEPTGALLVGTPYPERITIARKLSATYPLSVQGAAWKGLVDAKWLPSMPRIATLRAIREARHLVINVQHEQFSTGLNPQFFDYAAAGIPQLVIYPHAPNVMELPLARTDIHIPIGEPILSQQHRSQADVITRVRSEFMFHSCLERLIS